MRVDLLTKEYPPEIYGGAGVHVAELTKALRSRVEVQVRCFGAPRDEAGVTAYRPPAELADANGSLSTLGVDLQMAQGAAGTDLVHSHTWYANAGGHLAKLLHGVPHVVTAHSLEPLRPWKAEQLGGGYRISSEIERTAYEAADAVIAVSRGMGDDILRSYPQVEPARLHVVYNGIDLNAWRPNDDRDLVRSLGVDPDRPTVIFVGRITRQKGLPYLLRAAASLPPEVQLVLCAGAPDTPEIMAEVSGLVRDLQEQRSGVVWIERILPRVELTALLTAADVFVCPSVYEPLGIVNLEAIRQPIELASAFGVIDVDQEDPTSINEFLEKPQDPRGLPDSPGEVLASMGNYVFDTDALIAALEADAERPGSKHDMGGDIIPAFVEQGEAGVYDLNRNEVPGSTDRDRFYWRDVGSIESFYDAHMDLVSALPVFNLYNRRWPIYTQTLNSPPAKFNRDSYGNNTVVHDSIVSPGSIFSGSRIQNSVLGPWAVVESGASVTDSVLFDRVRIGAGAVVQRAILDKNAIIAEGARVGVEHDRDRERGLTVTDSGIVVVGKGVRVDP